jgi:gluconokinase
MATSTLRPLSPMPNALLPKQTPLDLCHAPALLFLFGVAGSGKSYIGDLIHRCAGWPIYHADEDLTAEMRQALADARPFTAAMRQRYFDLIRANLRQRLAAAPRLVVTQGAYKEASRQQIVADHPSCALIWVTAPEAVIEQRLTQRTLGISLASAQAIRADFEPPALPGYILMNSKDDEAIIQQLNRWFGSAAMGMD